ncbi:MAG: ankyrin repeat domain-containing protein [Chloroflexi bacterium]|nr:ankyrin repeat domain-containing protein [Chloroflexota bacterium]
MLKEPGDGMFLNSLDYLRLSSQLLEMQRRRNGDDEGDVRDLSPDLNHPENRILIPPWNDPEMIGQAILNIMAMAGPPTRNSEGSVFDRPRPKLQTKLHKAAIAGDLSSFPKTTRGNRSLDARDSEMVTPLMLAARSGAIEIVERLVTLGADSSLVDERGYTPLHHASLEGHILVVEMLLNAGAPIDVTDEVGRTPLHVAAAHGCSEVAARLLASGADVRSRDEEYESTPLHLAARGGHAGLVPILVSHGADVDAMNEAGRTPLHVAASYGYADVVNALVGAGADVNYQDVDGETPLFRPVFFQHEDILRLLISSEGDVHVTDANGDSPLHVAAKMNRERAAAILIDSGANLEALNAEGLTPIDCALVNPHFSGGLFGNYGYREHNSEVAELLAQRGATLDPMRLPVEERHILWPHLTPVEFLMPSGDIDEVKVFLGITRGERHDTGLWRTVWRNAQGRLGMKEGELPPPGDQRRSLPESARSALELASRTEWQPHHQSKYVNASSMLHDAVEKDMIDLVEFLLLHGVSMAPVSHSGGTPLHRASACGREKAARVLLERGADIEAPQDPPGRLHPSARAFGRHIRPGWTALDQAISSGQIGMVTLLLDMGAKPPDRLEDALSASFLAISRVSFGTEWGFQHPLSTFNKHAFDAIVDLFHRRGTPIVGFDKLQEINQEWERKRARLAREKKRAARREAMAN